MQYRLLDGVILARVCDDNILVATRLAWGKCPYTKTISALKGAFWQGLSLKMSEDEIIEELLQKTKIKEDALRKSFLNFIEMLTADGYLQIEDDQI